MWWDECVSVGETDYMVGLSGGRSRLGGVSDEYYSLFKVDWL